MRFTTASGATPIEPKDLEGLIPKHISTQNELNELEASNILEGKKWAFGKKRNELLEEKFIKQLHKRMFAFIWKWAGTFRKSDKNLGIPWYNIVEELKILSEDTKYWIKNKTYNIDEIAIRFHHRLVFIHPFPNGNGRHARMMADLILYNFNNKMFSWGNNSLLNVSSSVTECRKKYLEALKEADRGNLEPLIKFAKS
jgi:Fic-DOC domain mobile mystery protein B